jgi:hypothetical protein
MVKFTGPGDMDIESEKMNIERIRLSIFLNFLI